MASTLSKAIRALLDPSSPELPVHLQHRIAAWARHHDDIGSMVDLLARPELDDEVDALFADDRRAKVRAAWLSRPGRDPETLNKLIARETRETVLAAVASTRGLDENIYRAIVDRCRGVKPLIAVTLGDAPLEIRCAAIATLASRHGQIFERDMLKLHQAMKNTPELRIAVLRAGTVAALVRAAFINASDHDLTEVDAERLLELLVIAPVQAALDGGPPRFWSLNQAATDAYRLLGSVLSLEDRRDEVVELLSRPLQLDWGKAVPASTKQAYQEKVDSLKEGPQIGGRPITELRAALYDGPEEARAEAVAQLLKVDWNSPARNYSSQLLQAAALDGVLGKHLRTVLAEHQTMQYTIVGMLARRRGLSVFDAVTVAQACAQADDAYEVLSNSAEPRRALEAFITDPGTEPSRLVAFFSKYSFEDPSLIAMLPVAVLDSAASSNSRALLAEVSAYLIERIGDDPERWELFDQIASGAATSIGAVLDMLDISLVAA